MAGLGPATHDFHGVGKKTVPVRANLSPPPYLMLSLRH